MFLISVFVSVHLLLCRLRNIKIPPARNVAVRPPCPLDCKYCYPHLYKKYWHSDPNNADGSSSRSNKNKRRKNKKKKEKSVQEPIGKQKPVCQYLNCRRKHMEDSKNEADKLILCGSCNFRFCTHHCNHEDHEKFVTANHHISYRTVVDGVNNILNSNLSHNIQAEMIRKLLDGADRISELEVHVMHFIRYYLLYLFENYRGNMFSKERPFKAKRIINDHEKKRVEFDHDISDDDEYNLFPEINVLFVSWVRQVLCSDTQPVLNCVGLKAKLLAFYQNHYRKFNKLSEDTVLGKVELRKIEEEENKLKDLEANEHLSPEQKRKRKYYLKIKIANMRNKVNDKDRPRGTFIQFDSESLSQSLEYACQEIVENYRRTIIKNYFLILQNYVNIYWVHVDQTQMNRINEEFKIGHSKRKAAVDSLYLDLKKVREDIIAPDNSPFVSPAKYHEWIKEQQTIVLPNIEMKFGVVRKDIRYHWQEYLPATIYMNCKVEEWIKDRKSQVEQLMEENDEEEGQEEIQEVHFRALLKVGPTRSTIKPCNFTFDTTSAIELWWDCLNIGKEEAKHVKKQDLQDDFHHGKYREVWEKFFDLSKSPFKKLKKVGDENNPPVQQVFNYSMSTNGFCCGVLNMKATPKKKKKMDGVTSNDDQEEDELEMDAEMDDRDEMEYEDDDDVGVNRKEEKYVTQVDWSQHQDCVVVAIDPNKDDRYFGVSTNVKDDDVYQKMKLGQEEVRQVVYRDTYSTWAHDCQIQKSQIKLQKAKNDAYNGTTAQQLEADFSEYCSLLGVSDRSMNTHDYGLYLLGKHRLNYDLRDFYNKLELREAELHAHRRRQIAKTRAKKSLEKSFGPLNKIVLCVGDWYEKRNRKGYAPSSSKALRDQYRSYGVTVYLVDEYCTSCKCSNCEGYMVPCREVVNKRKKDPDKPPNMVNVHGLLECSRCNTRWNRDLNAACNIFKIVMAAMRGEARPLYLNRPH